MLGRSAPGPEAGVEVIVHYMLIPFDRPSAAASTATEPNPGRPTGSIHYRAFTNPWAKPRLGGQRAAHSSPGRGGRHNETLQLPVQATGGSRRRRRRFGSFSARGFSKRSKLWSLSDFWRHWLQSVHSRPRERHRRVGLRQATFDLCAGELALDPKSLAQDAARRRALRATPGA